MSEDQLDLFEMDAAQTLLDKLLLDSRLYTQSPSYLELMQFLIRLRNCAPFNAMLLQIQKPGLSYAASAHDWREVYGRTPKEDARPLLIMWPFGPVALVYDVLDTEGKDLPQDVSFFPAQGAMDKAKMASFEARLIKKRINVRYIDAGDRKAGAIEPITRDQNSDGKMTYRITINKNHEAPAQFATLAHELAHLFLGHLGGDKFHEVPCRVNLPKDQIELEAESVAYLVCARNEVESKSETYLCNYVKENTMLGSIDIYRMTKAAGQIEHLLGLAAHTNFDQPARKKYKA